MYERKALEDLLAMASDEQLKVAKKIVQEVKGEVQKNKKDDRQEELENKKEGAGA